MKKVLALLVSVLVLVAASGAFAFPKLVRGRIVMDFDLSDHPVDKEVKLWIPYPISSAYQTITNVRVTGNYTESGVYTDKKYQTSILYARWQPGSKSRKLRFQFDAERLEVVRRNFPSKEPCWDPTGFSMWLSPSSRGPISGSVRDLAENITKGKKLILGKAKAIYDWVCENTYRDPNTRGCGMGDVLAILKKRGGKCTDIHSVFVALCRAAGIPAREIFGIRMGKKEKVDITKWQHCWAEFYFPGYGWVPVDPADVRKMMLVHNLSNKDPETQKWRQYFWGAWDPYRIKLAIGRDLQLNPPQSGSPLNTFGYPYAEIGGKPLDWLDPETFKYKIVFMQR